MRLPRLPQWLDSKLLTLKDCWDPTFITKERKFISASCILDLFHPIMHIGERPSVNSQRALLLSSPWQLGTMVSLLLIWPQSVYPSPSPSFYQLWTRHPNTWSLLVKAGGGDSHTALLHLWSRCEQLWGMLRVRGWRCQLYHTKQRCDPEVPKPDPSYPYP